MEAQSFGLKRERKKKYFVHYSMAGNVSDLYANLLNKRESCGVFLFYFVTDFTGNFCSLLLCSDHPYLQDMRQTCPRVSTDRGLMCENVNKFKGKLLCVYL